MNSENILNKLENLNGILARKMTIETDNRTE